MVYNVTIDDKYSLRATNAVATANSFYQKGLTVASLGAMQGIFVIDSTKIIKFYGASSSFAQSLHGFKNIHAGIIDIQKDGGGAPTHCSFSGGCCPRTHIFH